MRFNANSFNHKSKQDNFALSAGTTSTQVTKIDNDERQGNYDVLLDKLNTVVTRDG